VLALDNEVGLTWPSVSHLDGAQANHQCGWNYANSKVNQLNHRGKHKNRRKCSIDGHISNTCGGAQLQMNYICDTDHCSIDDPPNDVCTSLHNLQMHARAGTQMVIRISADSSFQHHYDTSRTDA
jgi:hypothetical protein